MSSTRTHTPQQIKLSFHPVTLIPNPGRTKRRGQMQSDEHMLDFAETNTTKTFTIMVNFIREGSIVSEVVQTVDVWSEFTVIEVLYCCFSCSVLLLWTHITVVVVPKYITPKLKFILEHSSETVGLTGPSRYSKPQKNAWPSFSKTDLYHRGMRMKDTNTLGFYQAINPHRCRNNTTA
jgi:hypothetical protein